jgi:hypothetical protein
MDKSRKDHFDAATASAPGVKASPQEGIWELPDQILDQVSGSNDFTQSQPGGGYSFAQGFSCFAQNVGGFSQGTPPGGGGHYQNPGTN